jgi:hypothetical protein
MHNDLEPQAAALVGKLVFSFARLDFILALALRNLIPSSAPDDLNPLIERLGFKDRLDSLRDLVGRSTGLKPAAVSQFEAWYPTADRLRTTRNAFVHGRWGMQTHETLFNASTKVGKALSGEAKNYSLSELESEALQAKQVLDTFHDWHSRYVVGAV